MILYGPHQLLARWAGDRLGVADFGKCKTIGVMRKGSIAAVAVFNNYLHPNIEISFVTANPRWATPEAIRAILSYPFIQLECKRITATTEATNQRARAFLCRLGFREEGYHTDALPTGDAVSYGLLRKDAARWIDIEEDHGKSVTARSA